MRVNVNMETCNGFGNCTQAAPEVFAFEPDGTLKLLKEEIGEALREAVEEAIDLCPTQSISLIED